MADNINNINSLPPELVSRVFNYFDVTHFGILARVCQHWRQLANAHPSWNHFFLLDPLPN
jgi:hypothetical protein